MNFPVKIPTPRSVPVLLLILAALAYFFPVAGLIMTPVGMIMGFGSWMFGTGFLVYGILKWAVSALIFWLAWKWLSNHLSSKKEGKPS